MVFSDTHAHLYLDAFNDDRDEVINRAFNIGVKYIFVPNIDSRSLELMNNLCWKFPGKLFPMAGLHPTSVKEDFAEQLDMISLSMKQNSYKAIGECGIDLYWDSTFVEQQKEAFSIQLDWSEETGLPVSIHIRNAFKEVFEVLESKAERKFNGIFHCFSGNYDQALRAIEMGFLIGIGGVVTFKNTKLQDILKKIDPSNIVLETDSPFLAPAPYRGKRNESSYIRLIAEKLAEIWNMPIQQVAEITTNNALSLFKIERDE